MTHRERPLDNCINLSLDSTSHRERAGTNGFSKAIENYPQLHDIGSSLSAVRRNARSRAATDLVARVIRLSTGAVPRKEK